MHVIGIDNRVIIVRDFKLAVVVTQNRELARAIQRDYRVSHRKSCRLIFLHPSVYRRDDRELASRLLELSNIRMRYSIERLYILLKRQGWKDNRKRVYKIYCEEGLNLRKNETKE